MLNKIAIKNQLVVLCSEIQQEKIKLLQTTMDDAQQSANEYGQPKDRYDSYRMQLLHKRDMIAKQLSIANNDFIALQKINKNNENKKVEFGSVAITEDQNVFISISLGKIEVDEKIFYAISPTVPLFESMKGMKKGDTFDFRGKQSKIIDLF